jgi:hypothetical protein
MCFSLSGRTGCIPVHLINNNMSTKKHNFDLSHKYDCRCVQQQFQSEKELYYDVIITVFSQNKLTCGDQLYVKQ